MRLDLGTSVRCSDTAFGELADVVVDPAARRVTHLVVEEDDSHGRRRLVPVTLVVSLVVAAVLARRQKTVKA